MTIINSTWNFIFVHIPKCGGTSLAHTLEPLCTWRDYQLGGTRFGERIHAAYAAKFGIAKHSFAEELRRHIGRGDWNRYISFATVRDPLSRTISTYRYLRQHQHHYHFMAEYKGFDEFIASEHWRQNGPDRMFLPQCRWTTLETTKGLNQIVDEFVKLEELEDKLPALMGSVGVPTYRIDKLKFTKKNSSEKNETIDPSKSSLALIAERYKDDYEIFGYDSPIDVPS